MPPRMQEIFNLSRKQHLSHKEIANLLGTSENNVKKQVQSALFLLKNNRDINTYVVLIAFMAIGI
ncbi:sigma factor-like helix-turn-helix DNA-binding protein [Pedobacter sp. AW31-3R]|uniref:sigma factor-like helix-turn-helix DNA-binding protein n=1 Tax=Pedobacter sp. AW31-3R TaxID=3445781 RepID=UPI003FA05949